MRIIQWSLALGFLALAAPANGQMPSARLNSIFPCGGRQGTTIQCTIAGADLDGVSGLDFSHPGLTAKLIVMNQFEVTVAPQVPPGVYDVRAISPRGLSNFRAFSVDDWLETIEAEPNDTSGQAQQITLPSIVSGRIDKSTDVDCFSFSTRKGQRVLIDGWAFRIDSPLDGTIAVLDSRGEEIAYSGDYAGKDPFLDFTAPEDGVYVVKIWDFVYGGGPDHVYRLRIGNLPYLDAVIPAALRGGEKTKLTLLGRNLPGGQPAPESLQDPGVRLEVITREVDLPAELIQEASLRGGEAIRPPQTALDGMPFRLTTPEGSSNPIFLGFSDAPSTVEQETNNHRAAPQQVPFPCEVTGSFAPAGDVDYYAFLVPRGEKVVVEVFGERQSGQIDPFLAGFDPSGKRVFSGDDGAMRDIGQLRFSTRTRDARWEFTTSGDGPYLVQVRDLYFQQRGAVRFGYRLSIRRPAPDFRLLAVPTHETQPDATTVGRGGRSWLDVLAFRNDGFDGPIRVEAHDLPAGVSCDPVVIGPGKTSAPLVVHAESDAPIGHASVRIIGTASIQGREVSRLARGGGLTWPTVNTPGIARMADNVPVAVRESPPFVLSATIMNSEVHHGETIPIAVALERAADWNGIVQLSGFDLPPGTEVSLGSIPASATAATLHLNLPARLPPGPYSFIIQGAGQVPRDYLAQRDQMKPRGNNVRVIFPSNSITITVRAAVEPVRVESKK
jgi:hypothetical protein